MGVLDIMSIPVRIEYRKSLSLGRTCHLDAKNQKVWIKLGAVVVTAGGRWEGSESSATGSVGETIVPQGIR